MNNYTLEQRKEIINAFIIQEVAEDKPITKHLSRLIRDGYKHWDFERLIESIRDNDKPYELFNIDDI